MPRLSRAETQARTREKLLSTATTCFLRDGYAATSLEGIAEAAGYSKGAVYSNFRNKDELCLEVLERVRGRRAQSLAEAVVGADSLEQRLLAFEAWAEKHIGDRAWTTLEIEFAIHAGRHPELAARLVKDNEAIRMAITAVVAEHARRDAIDLPMPVEDLGLALLSLGVGLGLQRALDPAVSIRPLTQLVRAFASTRAPERGARPRAGPVRRRSRKA